MFTLHPYQRACLRRLIKAVLAKMLGVVFVMASGLGKTVTAAFFAKWFRENVVPNGRVLVLCHQNDILDQFPETFRKVLGPKSTYGFFRGEEKDLVPVDVLYASFQTMASQRERFSPDYFSLVIVDESHHSPAKTFAPTIEYFKPKFRVGMTATLDRVDQKDSTELFGPVVYSLPLPKALAKPGLLAKVRYSTYFDHLADLKEIKADAKNISLAELNRRFFIPRRDGEIAKIVAERIKKTKDPKTMIFCRGIKHARHFASVLAREGVSRIRLLHSKMRMGVQKDNLEAFRSGNAQVLITVDKMNEGINVEDVNIVVFLRRTDSQRIFWQQLGRGLRRKKKGANLVYMLDFVGSWQRIRDIVKLQTEVRKYAADSDPFEIQLEGQFVFRALARKIMYIVDLVQQSAQDRCWSDRQVLHAVKNAIQLGLSIPILGMAYNRFGKKHRKLKLPSWGAIVRRWDYLKSNGIALDRGRICNVATEAVAGRLRQATSSGLKQPLYGFFYTQFRKENRNLRLPWWSALERHKAFFEARGFTFQKQKGAPINDVFLVAAILKAANKGVPLNCSGYSRFRSKHPELNLPCWTLLHNRRNLLKKNGICIGSEWTK